MYFMMYRGTVRTALCILNPQDIVWIKEWFLLLCKVPGASPRAF